MKHRMRILLASSEVYPWSKTGGLADMVGALGKSLAAGGDEVGIVTPLYRGVRDRFRELQPFGWVLDLQMGGRRQTAMVWTLRPRDRVTIYFVDAPEFFDRAGIYQENGDAYADNAERFILFSKCVVSLARNLPWKPDVLHVHDWHTGLVPLLVRHEEGVEGWENPPATCLTVHNLAYQGVFPARTFAQTNLPWDYFTLDGAEYYGSLNCLKAGIVFADAVTTVSPRYAREILTEEFGCGLDGVLRARRQLAGILNGVDYEEWNSAHDLHLRHHFTLQDRSGKAAAKTALQREMGLPPSGNTPLFASITRLAEQKGVDILLGALDAMTATGLQFILLGSGAPEYSRAARQLAARHPDKVAVHIGFDEALSHRIEAGSDFFLMPSRFEPCGLNQMYSQRYGTIPVVRAVGGLDDTVVDLTQDPTRATGIKFRDYSAQALSNAMRKAMVLFAEPELLRHVQTNAMQADFSWRRTAQEYRQVYSEA